MGMGNGSGTGPSGSMAIAADVARDSASAKESNNGPVSVSRVFHRNNHNHMRSLSLASVSDITKA